MSKMPQIRVMRVMTLTRIPPHRLCKLALLLCTCLNPKDNCICYLISLKSKCFIMSIFILLFRSVTVDHSI